MKLKALNFPHSTATFKSFVKPALAGLVLLALTAGSVMAAPAAPTFTAQEQAAISSYAGHFKAIRTQAQLLAAYREALLLQKKIDPRLEKYMESLRGEMPSDAQM